MRWLKKAGGLRWPADSPSHRGESTSVKHEARGKAEMRSQIPVYKLHWGKTAMAAVTELLKFDSRKGDWEVLWSRSEGLV